MAKKGGFFLGFILGSVVSYEVTKYVLPMTSKEDLMTKIDDIKDSFNDSINSVNKEQIIDNFNTKTSDIKNSIDKKMNRDSDDINFENIIVDESNLDLDD